MEACDSQKGTPHPHPRKTTAYYEAFWLRKAG